MENVNNANRECDKQTGANVNEMDNIESDNRTETIVKQTGKLEA